MRPFPFFRYGLLLFSLVVLSGLAGFAPQSFDTALLSLAGSVLTWAEPLLQAADFAGETWPSFFLAVAAVTVLWLKGFRSAALGLVTALILVSLASAGIKVIIDRPRPGGADFSFVSGHTAYFTVLCGFLFHRAGELTTGRYRLPVLRGLLMAALALVGLSRLYLEAHWPSDVLGGLLLGGAVLIPVLWRLDRGSPVSGEYTGEETYA
ncbi:phosphoesterase PA-phosphatase related protein [Dehalogenimonas lykanthroporepellens BL-DC-9]|nr:phosphoesterase PA-phosphatase related protein [Dehalogenimonas lykanthroporepellens BL-DC-9]